MRQKNSLIHNLTEHVSFFRRGYSEENNVIHHHQSLKYKFINHHNYKQIEHQQHILSPGYQQF